MWKKKQCVHNTNISKHVYLFHTKYIFLQKVVMSFTIIPWTIIFFSIYILRFIFPVLQIFQIWVTVSFSVKSFQYFESDIFKHYPWHTRNIPKDLRKGLQEIIKGRRENISISSYYLTYSYLMYPIRIWAFMVLENFHFFVAIFVCTITQLPVLASIYRRR